MKRARKAAAGIAVGLLAVVLLPGAAFADEVRDGQWYLDTLNVHDAHELSQGAGVTIGVIDTGVNAEHTDLEGQVIGGTDLVDSSGDGLDDYFDHGTAVASVLAGQDDAEGVLGIAPKATVLSVNIFAEGAKTTEAKLMATAIHWLIDNGADVINISVGGGGDGATKAAIDRAAENGVPIVASAGNRYQDYGYGEQETSGTSNPAAQSGAIPVTAITPEGVFFEDSLDLSLASQQPKLGISAPGAAIPVAAADGGHRTTHGTSFAAPIVAGTLALIKSAYPDLSYDQMVDRLLDTVDDKGPEGYDDKYGWGIVNPLAALTEETVYESASGDQISSPDDRLPLEEQGKRADDDDPADGDDEGGESGASVGDDEAGVDAGMGVGVPVWAWITVAAVAVLGAGVTAALLFRHRNRTRAAAGVVAVQPSFSGGPVGSVSASEGPPSYSPLPGAMTGPDTPSSSIEQGGPPPGRPS